MIVDTYNGEGLLWSLAILSVIFPQKKEKNPSTLW